MQKLKIGVLELGYRHHGQSGMHSVIDVLEYAGHADELGFSRFWLGEHHDFFALASWATPQMLLPLLLRDTERINVGMAGVLMNYYSPYEIACNFKMLANLFPGRCDLGFAGGRPPNRIGLEMFHHFVDRVPDIFNKNATRVSRYFNQEDDVFKEEKILIPPLKGLTPDLFMLSSSFRNYEQAINDKMHIAKSIFHRPNTVNWEERDTIERYREGYLKKHGVEPQMVIALMGTCHYREAEAQRRAEAFSQELHGFRSRHNAVVGNPEQLQEGIYEMSEKLGINEFVIYDCTVNNEEKIESLNLISEAFQLNPATVTV